MTPEIFAQKVESFVDKTFEIDEYTQSREETIAMVRQIINHFNAGEENQIVDKFLTRKIGKYRIY